MKHATSAPVSEDELIVCYWCILTFTQHWNKIISLFWLSPVYLFCAVCYVVLHFLLSCMPWLPLPPQHCLWIDNADMWLLLCFVQFYKQSEIFKNTLHYMNAAFTALFTLECSLKLAAYGVRVRNSYKKCVLHIQPHC